MSESTAGKKSRQQRRSNNSEGLHDASGERSGGEGGKQTGTCVRVAALLADCRNPRKRPASSSYVPDVRCYLEALVSAIGEFQKIPYLFMK